MPEYRLTDRAFRVTPRARAIARGLRVLLHDCPHCECPDCVEIKALLKALRSPVRPKPCRAGCTRC